MYRVVVVFAASSGVATLRATHLSRVSLQTSGPVHPAALMLLMKTHDQTEFFCLEVCALCILLRNRHSPCLVHLSQLQAFVSLLVISVGRRVWAFNGYNPVQGYPKKISSFGLPRGVRKIHAAFYDVESGKTLFFVGKHYYR